MWLKMRNELKEEFENNPSLETIKSSGSRWKFIFNSAWIILMKALYVQKNPEMFDWWAVLARI